jgi:ABC-2 type transport system ATP-binding protein
MITLQGISVIYRLIREYQRSTFQEYVINYLKGRRIRAEAFSALKDLNLEVSEGESLGIIGDNGAGKSTLLKVISGVIIPTRGKVTVNGRIAPLIELGAGFDHDLTGRENIYLNASILGFSRSEIKKKFERIVDFSELSEFLDTPLRNYSSGMVARLGFSIATEVNPAILILDEILAVGDAHFTKKSEERIAQFIKKGVTVIFVSHAMEDIKAICNKVLWLDHGIARMLGDPDTVIGAYERFQPGNEEIAAR